MHLVRWILGGAILLSMLATGGDAAADETPTPEPRIVGGVEAAPGEIPWQVLVRPAGYLCGGSLVDASYVITAAHCVVNDAGAPISPSQITIVAGEYTRGASEGDEQTRSVSALYVHPSYDADTFDNDIALLRLASPVTLNARVATIALARDAALGDAGMTALVSGWGTTSSGGSTASTLRKVTMPIVSNATCAGSYGSSITANMLCAGLAAGGVDSCQGDSGGPLAVQRNGSWYLAGVVSWGNECAAPAYYGVYTRVSRFISWLDGYLPSTTTPALTVNYAAGAPCSSFLIEGSDYGADATVQISINGVALGEVVAAGDGTLQLLLESDCAADAGGYRVIARDVGASGIAGRAASAAQVAYQLVTSGPNAVVRAAPSGAPAPVPVPASVTPLRVLFLPLVRR